MTNAAKAFDPVLVYKTLYESVLIHCLERSYCTASLSRRQSQIIRGHLIALFSEKCRSNPTTVQLHWRSLTTHGSKWAHIRSNRVCLYCIRRKPELVLSCGHSICEVCLSLFGRPSKRLDYLYRLDPCLLCSSGDLEMKLQPPTASPRILSIDGGGVRGVIPLEFLKLLQDAIGPECAIQSLFDLAIGTSSGKFVDIKVSVR